MPNALSPKIRFTPVCASSKLPLLYNNDDPELIRNGMYISPKLLTQDAESLGIYCKSLDNADMLMFNLHGADAKGMCGFYSEAEAFNPSLLSHGKARVFNTVACFGARYAGYDRNDSMLLSALYGGGVLLYTGSLVTWTPFAMAARSAAIARGEMSFSEFSSVPSRSSAIRRMSFRSVVM